MPGPCHSARMSLAAPSAAILPSLTATASTVGSASFMVTIAPPKMMRSAVSAASAARLHARPPTAATDALPTSKARLDRLMKSSLGLCREATRKSLMSVAAQVASRVGILLQSLSFPAASISPLPCTSKLHYPFATLGRDMSEKAIGLVTVLLGAWLYFLGWVYIYFFFLYFSIDIYELDLPIYFILVHSFSVIRFLWSSIDALPFIFYRRHRIRYDNLD